MIQKADQCARQIRRAEWGVALAASAVLVVLHATFLFSAGGLWRDEVESVNFASLPSLKTIWTDLQYQSFPIGWFAFLRGWLRLGFGRSDPGIRLLGLLVGLAILGALWRNARALGQHIPLLSFALVGFNVAVISYGDAIRGYGIGVLAGILTFGLMWSAVDVPDWRRSVFALLAGLIAVQTLYFNVVLVFAGSLAGAAVALRRKSWRSGATVLAVAVGCALSLVPYVRMIRHRRVWSGMSRVELDSAYLWTSLREALATTGSVMPWVWLSLAITALLSSMYFFSRRAAGPTPSRSRDAALFCAVSIVAGLPAYILFLKILGYGPQPWYYVLLIALVGSCVDAPLSLAIRGTVARTVRLAVVIGLMWIAIHPIWVNIRTRKTNVDLVASKLRNLARAGDLIVVNPWYFGITFENYYRGRGDVITIPPMPFLGFHRYDLLRQRLMSARPIRPVLMAIRTALASGHRVFWVGELFLPRGNEIPIDPPPAPNAPWGWSDGPYYYAWALEAGYVIRSDARTARRIEVPAGQLVSPYEDVALHVFGRRSPENSGNPAAVPR